MKVEIKPLGALAISIFIIFFTLPFLYTYYNYSKIPKFQLVFFLVSNIIFIASLIYSFIKVAESDKSVLDNYDKVENYQNKIALYMLLTEGGYKNFQIWYASIANNAWLDVLFSILLFMIPFPLLPASPLGRFEIMLSKLGIYKISLAIVLGNPKYQQYDNYFKQFPDEEKIEMGLSLGLLVLFIIYIIYDLSNINLFKKSNKKNK